MKDNKEIRNELESLSPFLAGMKNEQPFKVPANYFEQMQGEVLRQLKIENSVEKQPSKQVSWLDQLIHNFQILLQPRYAVSFATIVVLIVAGIFFLRSGEGTSTDADYLAGLSLEDTQQYIATNIDEFEAEWLMDLVAEDDLMLNDAGLEEEIDAYLDEIINDLDDSELKELL